MPQKGIAVKDFCALHNEPGAKGVRRVATGENAVPYLRLGNHACR